MQTDLTLGSQLPVCLPLHATQDEEYQYNKYVESGCPVSGASGCSTGYNHTYNFSILKPFYKLVYHISLRLYSSASH